MAPGIGRPGIHRSGAATTLALDAFRVRVERSRLREIGSGPRTPSCRLFGTGDQENANAKVIVADSQRSTTEASFRRHNNTPQSTRASNTQGIFNNRFSKPVGLTDFLQGIINASPGLYANDDGSSDISDRYNFFAHGKRFLFAPCSLGVFDESNVFRQFVVWIITSKLFDRVVLFLIAANSVMLAIVDVRHVDKEGNPLSTGSMRNTVADYSNSIFTALFTIECLMKIVAMGLIGERGAYLKNPWNWIDFTVVVVGLLGALPSIPSTAGLRAFLVLRPLRFFNAVPGIRKLATSLLKSIPELFTVVVFLSFLFFFYGVIGVQLWSGSMHPRCRLSPYPLALDVNLSLEELPTYEHQVLATPETFQCLDVNSLPLEVENEAWSHDSSPWKTPRYCFWPVADEGDSAQLCNLDNTNDRLCPIGQTCGSDYDKYGNFRFTHPDERIRTRLQLGATFDPNLSFGLLGFDNLGQAAMVLFICMPREGWSDVMYMLQDAGFGATASIFLVSFVLISSYFMLNLALAIIWENFSEESMVEAEQQKLKHERKSSKSAPPLATGKCPVVYAKTFIQRLLNHWIFSTIVTTLILLNTVLLSLDQYPVDESLASIVDVLNFVLTLLFLLEAVIKVFGLGFYQWSEDRYNLFDAMVVALGVVEAFVSPPQFLSGSAHAKSQSFAGLRSMRIFRLFKLARSWPSLQNLLGLIGSAMSEIGNFSVFLLLFMYVYALLGMQIFGNRFRFDGNGVPIFSPAADIAGPIYVPRANFDSLLWSGVTVFQVLTGENWNAVMFDSWRSTGLVGVIYFLSLVVLGNFIVLNLFLAILLSHFEDADEASVEANHTEAKDALRMKSRVLPVSNLPVGNGRGGTRRRSAIDYSTDGACGSNTGSQQQQSPHLSPQSSATGLGNDPVRPSTFHSQNTVKSESKIGVLLQKPKTPQGRSLFLLGPYNPLRRFAWNIVTHPRFDGVVFGLVIASTACVALDNPLSSPDSTFARAVSYVDSVLAAIFALEVVLKIIAQGFFLHHKAYLRDGWNIMDLTITFVAIPGLQGSKKLKFISNLRTLRALRPLRMIHRNPGLRLVVNSLVSAIPQILNVGMVCLLLLLIFSIIAVNNLKGRFYACGGDVFDALTTAQQALISTPRLWTNLTENEKLWFDESAAVLYASASSLASVSTEDLPGVDGITSRMVCSYFNASWDRTIPQSFDNVLLALLTFYEISTTEGWVKLMLAGVDATNVDMQPIANHHEAWTLFFITFIFLGSFFFIQLFIGVVIENFNRMKETLDGTRHLSTSQREWLLISETVLNLRPMRKIRTPRNPLRRLCFDMARSSILETVTMGAIVLNTFLMGLTYFGEEDLYARIIDYANVFFTVMFAFEAVIKIIGLGRYYWKDSWNIFDFIVVIGSCCGMTYTWATVDAVGSSAAAIRGVRVLRLVKLIRTAPSLRQLVNTLVFTLPSLVNIGGFLFLVFFIYAAVGVQLFAKVKMGEILTPLANFQSISVAMVTLIRCATGERWDDLMHELASTDDCVQDPEYDPNMCGFANFEGCIPLNGCGTPVAFLYFCSFTMLITYILLNIFVAVILEGFANEKDRTSGVLLPQHYENFVATWSTFDPDATGTIQWHLLPKLIQELDEPLGYGKIKGVPAKEIAAFIDSLDVAMFNGNQIFFHDVARKLGKSVLDAVSESTVPELPNTIAATQKWRVLMKGGKFRTVERYHLKHLNASVLLHDAVRSLIFREELRAQVQKFTDLTSIYLSARPSPKGDGLRSRRGSIAKSSIEGSQQEL